jgi:hypothetical protein
VAGVNGVVVMVLAEEAQVLRLVLAIILLLQEVAQIVLDLVLKVVQIMHLVEVVL